MDRTCACGCGRPLTGRPAKTRYFEAKCRKAKFTERHSGRTRSSDREWPTVELVRAELEAAGRADTWIGSAATQIARRLDEATAVMGYAALVRELRATMADALAGVKLTADPLVAMQDELEARRARRRAG